MKIAIDARWIFEGLSGIGAYTLELVRAMARLERESRYVLLFHVPRVRDRVCADLDVASFPNFSTILLPYGVFSVRNQFALPAFLKREGIQVYHSPNYMIPLLAFPRSRRGRCRCVVTIHDVIPLVLPQHAPRSRKSRVFPIYRRLMIEVGARAHAIISDSRNSRADVIRQLRIPPDREQDVHAVYCGVSDVFRPRREVQPNLPFEQVPRPEPRLERSGARASRKSSSGPQTVLYVGRADPYKNLVGLVNAFATVLGKLSFPIRLLIVGTPDERYPEAEQRARELGIGHAVTWTGYLPAAELVSAYQQASLLVLPSRYEGFGLPVIEAMACGTPVLCSDIGALREVAGDAALFVNPDDLAALSREIVRVLSDKALAADLSRKGLARASEFTWARTARETLAVYRRVLEAGTELPPERQEMEGSP